MVKLKILQASLLLLPSCNLFADYVELPQSSLKKPEDLREARVFYTNEGFKVAHKGRMHVALTDKLLKEFKGQPLTEYLKQNRISLHQFGNNAYELKSEARGLGGGPIFAALASCGVMVVGGVVTAGAAIGTTVVTLNPGAGFAVAVAGTHATIGAAGYTAIVLTATPTA